MYIKKSDILAGLKNNTVLKWTISNISKDSDQASVWFYSIFHWEKKFAVWKWFEEILTIPVCLLSKEAFNCW